MISGKGFYSQDGKWQDMTNFVVDPLKKAVINYAIEKTVDIARVGAIKVADEFYDEDKAKKLA